jgi:hypothetical protein
VSRNHLLMISAPSRYKPFASYRDAVAGQIAKDPVMPGPIQSLAL